MSDLRAVDRPLNSFQASELANISRSHLFKMVRLGRFPPGFVVGERKRVWWESEIQKFLQERDAATRAVIIDRIARRQARG